MEAQTLTGQDRHRFFLPEKVSDVLFHEAIVPFVFDGVEKAASPSIVFVGGQPGSGKSALLPNSSISIKEINAILEELNALTRQKP